MHPEYWGSLSIAEKLIQYYLISPGSVAVTLRVRFRTIRVHLHRGTEPAIVARDGAENSR
jgi:hypothetical protein